MKSRRRKIICVLVCILLCASFFVFSGTGAVSAASEDILQYYEPRWDFSGQVGSNNFTFGYDSIVSGDLFASIDSRTWSQMLTSSSNQGDKEFSIMEWGYHDDPTFALVAKYDVSDFGNLTSNGHFWSSFIFDNAPTLPANSNLTNNSRITLVNTQFIFMMGGQLYPPRVRFSLREYKNSTYSAPVFATRTIDIAWGQGTDRFGYLLYGVGANQLQFNRLYDNSYSGGDLYLCVDFDLLFQPIVNSSNWTGEFTLGVLDTSQIVIARAADSVTGSSAYHPELDEPWYEQPDHSLMGDIFDSEQSLLDDPLVVKDDITEFLNEVQIGFDVYTTGLFKVSTLMTELIQTVPGIQFVLFFSMAFGIYAFILGLASSIVGVSTERHSRSDTEFERKAIRDTKQTWRSVDRYRRMRTATHEHKRIEYKSPKK